MTVPRVVINKFPGIFGGGGGVTPIPGLEISAYADVPSSIVTTGATVNVWSQFTSSPGSEPLLITDTVTGGKAIRFDVGKTLSLPAITASFLHQKQTTVLVVWRSRNFTPGADFNLLDSSGDGATEGYQWHLKEAAGQYREIFGRISTGSGFSLNQPSTPVRNSYNAMQWNVTAIVTTANTFDSENGGVSILGYPPPITISDPFQTGLGGPLILGDATIDVAAIEAWSIPIDVSAAMARLASRFSCDNVITLWGDGTRYFGFGSIAQCANGDIIAVCRNGVDHSGDAGWIELRRCPSGSNPEIISSWGSPTIIQQDLSLDSRDPCLSVMSNGDILLSYFLQNFQVGAPDPLDTCWVRKSPDNGHTWGSPIQGTAGLTLFEACSGRIRDIGGGVYLWPIYGQNITDSHSSAVILKSTDGGASFATHVTLADGVADNVDYTEPGLLKLGSNSYLGVCREDTNGNMQERVSADAVSWGSPTNFPSTVPGNMAARIAQLASGRVIEMYRPGQYAGAATVITRTSPGNWTEPPVAMQIDGTPSPTDYGDFVDLGGGRIGVVYGVQLDLHGPSDVRFRVFDEWLIPGEMPLPITPSSVSLSVTNTQQFAAVGAGNVTWSLHQNQSGGSVDSGTGLYTAGAGNGTDIVRATDLNGFFADATVTVSGALWNPATPTGAYSWTSIAKLVGLNNGDPVPTLPNQVTTSFPNPPQTITGYTKIPGGGVAATYVTNATPGGRPAASFVNGTTTAVPVAQPSGNRDLSGSTKALFFATFKVAVLGAAQVIYGQAEAGYEWSIEGDGSDKLRALIANASSGKAVSNSSVVDGNWHYVIMVWDGATVTMILDGVTQTITGTAGAIPFHGDDVAIGAESSTGGIDTSTVPTFLTTDAGIWLDTWSGSDVTQLESFLAAAIS